MKLSAAVLAITLALSCFAEDSGLPPSFSWSAVDGLGRTVSPVNAPKPQKKRFAALFYWTWHYSPAKALPPRNNARITARYPKAVHNFNHPAWENTPPGTPYFWDEPLFGYYSTLDRYLLRKHASMLADAGVDVIVFECTNSVYTWKPAYDVLIDVFAEAMRDGVRVPKIAFMLNFIPNLETAMELRQIYLDIYQPERHPELWFRWDGKPLVMAPPEALDPKHSLDAEILQFFTFRRSEPGYFAPDTRLSDNVWGWCSVFPQTRFGKNGSAVEQMAVSVAQNASRFGLVAMNDRRGGVFGRGYAKGGFSAGFQTRNGSVKITKQSPGAWMWGLNFRQQWENARKADPDLVFITGWNEWTSGRDTSWQGSENAFSNEFNPEFSRDCEPSAGVLRDNFYCQLAAEIRAYKGGSALPVPAPEVKVDPASGFPDWSRVRTALTDERNDTPARDSDGWKGTHYTSPAMPRDIISAKIAYDSSNFYFLVETAAEINPPDGPAWMRLLLDFGRNPSWEGFNYAAGFRDGKLRLFRYTGNGAGKTELGTLRYRLDGRFLSIAVPKKLLGSDASSHDFGFKWCDAQTNPDDVLEFYKSGDAAPGGRFRCRFLTK